MSLFCTVCGI